jgi:hypothetical protein
MCKCDEWSWRLFGFESKQEGRPAQDWYDGPPLDHKIEVTALFSYLRNLTTSAWGRPFYDPLMGEGGISEIIIPDIRDELGVAYYRLYGWFGPGRQIYTFLHATSKRARNDKHGKRIARNRFNQLQSGNATIHEFSFE